MKKLLIPFFALCVSAGIAGDKVEIKTVTRTGTLHEYVPGKTFIVKETAGPVEYRFAPTVIYTSKSGRVLTDEQLKRRMKEGTPVWVHSYTEDGKHVVTRVEFEDD